MQAWQATVQDELGNVIPNPLISVFLTNGTTLAPIFNENGTAKANPFIGSLEGFAQFWAGPGKYKVRGASGAQVTQTWDVYLGALEQDFDSIAAIQASTVSLPAGTIVFARKEATSFSVVASGGQYTGTSFQFSELGPRFTTRARAAASVSAGNYAAGRILFVNGQRYRVDAAGVDGLFAVDMDFSGRVDMIRAAMSNGSAVRIAAFGDSTTEGQQTTGSPSPNATNGSGNATGNAAYVAPNAWPAVMQTILRRMYSNTSITVWNAGYGGKDLVDGWARRNFAAAIINKTAYGTPAACIVAFGANDIINGIFTPELYESELIKLISDMDYYGVVPIIATPDPMTVRLRQGGVIAKLISAINSVCKKYGIEQVDYQNALIDVYSSNGTNQLWVANQPDNIHFQDGGHRVKGSYASALMFEKTLWLDTQPEINISAFSRYANTQGIAYNVYNQANNRFGASANVADGSYATGSVLMEAWVWSKQSASDIYWRSVSGDGYFYPAALNAGPTIEVGEYISGSVTSLISPTAGQVQQGSPNRDAEVPVLVKSIRAGLSRLTFRAPTDANTRVIYLGYFTIRQNRYPYSTATFWESGLSGAQIRDPGIYDDNALLVGSGFSKQVRMTIDVAMPNAAGLLLYSGRVFTDGTSGASARQRGVMLLRNGSNVQLWEVAYDNTGFVNTAQIGTASYTWDEKSNEFTIRLGVNGSNQYFIQVTPAATPLTPVLSVTRPRTDAPWSLGGHFGAWYKAYGLSGDAGRAKATVIECAYV